MQDYEKKLRTFDKNARHVRGYNAEHDKGHQVMPCFTM